MGDDYYAGTYSMEFAEDAVMKDLVTVILAAGNVLVGILVNICYQMPV